MPDWVPPVAAAMAGGLATTVLLSGLAGAAAILLGVVLGSLATLRSPAVTVPIRAYVEVWRGLPIIVTLFLVFFVLPAVGVRLDAFPAALIGLTLWASANCTEIVRGAVRSVAHGQRLAATALGMGWAAAMLHVVLPQAARRMLPPLVSLLANLVQSSALAAVIGVLDLTASAERQIARLTVLGDSHALQILSAVMVVYFLVCLPLTRTSAVLERRLAR
ncbi:MAG: amino acid ABC transporter permease [Chloroflexi bacterium]|nr:MAG: amino acid ABC transporter permease [Chloroflexota bacterium]